jgi:hypothetical protein
MKSVLTKAPPKAPTTGTHSAAAFSERVNPNRCDMLRINPAMAGAPFRLNPRSAIWRDASFDRAGRHVLCFHVPTGARDPERRQDRNFFPTTHDTGYKPARFLTESI